MKAKLFVRAIALIALVTTLLIGSTMLAAPLVTVELCVDLQGTRATGNDEPVRYDLIDGSGAVVATVDASSPSDQNTAMITDSDTGCFLTPAVPIDSYEILFKSVDGETDHLTERVSFQIAVANETITLTEDGANVMLIDGDANGDNQIDDSDFSIWVSSYNFLMPVCEGDASFQERADYNEDGCVDDSDFSIWVTDYNFLVPKTGES